MQANADAVYASTDTVRVGIDCLGDGLIQYREVHIGCWRIVILTHLLIILNLIYISV